MGNTKSGGGDNTWLRKVLERIEDHIFNVRRFMSESQKRWEENQRRWDENQKRWEHNEKRRQESQKRWEQNEKKKKAGKKAPASKRKKNDKSLALIEIVQPFNRSTVQASIRNPQSATPFDPNP